MQEMQEMWVRSLGWEDLLEEEMVTHFSIPAWKIPYIEESVWWGHRESEVTEYTPTGFIGHWATAFMFAFTKEIFFLS